MDYAMQKKKLKIKVSGVLVEFRTLNDELEEKVKEK